MAIKLYHKNVQLRTNYIIYLTMRVMKKAFTFFSAIFSLMCLLVVIFFKIKEPHY